MKYSFIISDMIVLQFKSSIMDTCTTHLGEIVLGHQEIEKKLKSTKSVAVQTSVGYAQVHRK